MTSTQVEVRRFTREEFHALESLGLWSEDDHIELLGGLLYASPAVNAPHATVIRRLTGMLHSLGPRLSVQLPVIISDYDEPEPDLAVLSAEWRERVALPTDREIDVLIEVSDRTRLAFDRETKLPRYLAAAARRMSAQPEVWIVDLVQRQLEVYTAEHPWLYGPESRPDARAILRPGEPAAAGLHDIELRYGIRLDLSGLFRDI